jgi:hypothetical protein
VSNFYPCERRPDHESNLKFEPIDYEWESRKNNQLEKQKKKDEKKVILSHQFDVVPRDKTDAEGRVGEVQINHLIISRLMQGCLWGSKYLKIKIPQNP